jgi:purine catabolism regulator
MGLALSDIMKLEVMAPARVVGGAAGLGNTVNGAAVIETPVEDFIKPGQLILTTAIGCENSETTLMVFFEEIRFAGASGLAVAVGTDRYVERLGSEAVAWADRHGFPLIELPWALPFAAIIQSVLERIIADELSLLKQSECIRRSLTSILLESGNLPEIARTLETALGRPVLVLDDQLRVLVSSGPGPAGGEAAAGEDGAEGRPVRSVMRSARSGRMALLGGLPGYESDTVRALPVVASGQLFGYLGVVGGEDAVSGPLEQSALDHASAVAALYFLQQRAVAETELRLRGDFVWALAKGCTRDEADTKLMARHLGFRVGGRTRALVFQVGGSGSSSAAEKAGGHRAERASADRVAEIIQKTLRRSAKQVMMTYRQGLHVCFIEDLPGGDERHSPLALQVREEVVRLYPGASVSCGIGGAAQGLAGYTRSYEEAKKALDFGRVLRTEPWVGCYPQLLTLRILVDIARSQEAAALIDRYLWPLAEDGHPEASEAFRTLMSLTETGWNISKAARRLHIHRQTLLYRLDRIRASVGWDISSPSDRFAFQLAVHLHLLARIAGTDAQAGADSEVDDIDIDAILASAKAERTG